MQDVSVEFNPTVAAAVEALRQFGIGLETKALRAATVYSVRDLKKQLKSNLRAGRYATGTTAKSIGHRSLRASQRAAYPGADVALFVGATRKVLDVSGKRRSQEYKIRFLEGGVRAHREPRRGLKAMAINEGRVTGVFSRIEHHGFSAKRPVQRASDRTLGSLERDFYLGLRHWVETRQVITSIVDDT